MLRALLLPVLAALVLGGCGFHLRSAAELPFASAYVTDPSNSALSAQLARSIKDAGKSVADKAQDAQVVIKLSPPSRGKSILSLSGAGRVREYRLTYRVVMHVQAPGGEELLPPTDIQLTRDYTYDDQQILAKAEEEAQLYQNMEQDALRALLRRLRFVHGAQAGAGP